MVINKRDLVSLDKDTWQIEIFDITRPEERQALASLRASGPVWRVCDVLPAQQRALAELRAVAARNQGRRPGAPGAPTEGGAGHEADAGERWVYYPWSGNLVRLLAPAAFRELRQSRNLYKITAAEQARLGALTIGVVGLSSGAMAALTMALEGVGGHFKLADFDRIELSNLNRLRAGVHELGVPKTVAVARQIREIDPYVRLTLVREGITADNVDGFLGGADPVDVVVDACDSMDVKLLLRERARERGIPVLMETSDRGMIDVERFDEEPERPILHGLLGQTRAEELGDLSPEARLGVAARMVGATAVSARMAASALEIGHTLTTWPQLASEVTLGGASLAAAVRRIGLEQPLPSGRRYVDVEAILAPGPAAEDGCPTTTRRAPRRTLPARPRAVPRKDRACPEWAPYLVAHAALAPSGGNAQPWRFYAEPSRLWLTVDQERARNLLSVARRPVYLAMGAALENLHVAAAAHGWKVQTEMFPRRGDRDVVAALSLASGRAPATAEEQALIDALPRRCTNRKPGTGEPLALADARRLDMAAAGRGAQLELVQDPAAVAALAALVGEADRVRCLCAPLHREMIGELRWSAEQAAARCDGIDVATMELSDAELAGLRLIARPDVAAFLRAEDRGRALASGHGRALIGSSSAVGLLSVPGDDPAGWVTAGRAMQRVWLEATRMGLAMQPIGTVLYMLHMLDAPAGSVFLPGERAALVAQRARLATLFPRSRDRVATMMFRVARAPEPAVRSHRRPLSEILLAGAPPQAQAHVTAPVARLRRPTWLRGARARREAS